MPTGNASSSPTSTPRWPSCGSGQEAAVERRLAAMRETAAGGAEAAPLYRRVGIPVVAAFHRGAYVEVVQARFDLWQIGEPRAALSSTGP